MRIKKVILLFTVFTIIFLVGTVAASGNDRPELTSEFIKKVRAEASPMPFPDPSRAILLDEPLEWVWKFDLDHRPVNIDWEEPDELPLPAPDPKAGGPSRINNTSQYPYSSVVHLYMDYGGGYAGCSGAFIHDTHTILTAGHCIYNHDYGGYPDDIIIIPGHNGNQEPFGAKYAYNWGTNSSWIGSEDYRRDYGVILVQPFAQNTGFMGSIYDSDWDFYWDNEFDTAGYPGGQGYPGDQMWWAQDRIIDLSSMMLRVDYAFSSDPWYCISGQSGSAIYLNQGGGNYSITAVLTLASCHGVRVNNTILNFIDSLDCDGCQIGDECYDNGEKNPNNSCLVCDKNAAGDRWTDNDGAVCDDGLFCNGPDSCKNGSCSKHQGDPCPEGKVCTEEDRCIDPSDVDDDDDDENLDCADLLEMVYMDCGQVINGMAAEEAYELCKDDQGPWDCIFECGVHEEVSSCSDFALCLSSKCDLTASSDSFDDDDDDSSGSCGF